MIVAGLTGSIAMGKSTVAAMFAKLGAPVFDADEAVREFYAGDGARMIEATFPGVIARGQIDRDRLTAQVLIDVAAFRRLENLVHPAVAAARARFLKRAAAEDRRLTITDVPLLFETGGDSTVDLVVVVSAPETLQRTRALARDGMTEAKLETILSRQTSDTEKRRRAHFVIGTGDSIERTRAQVGQFMRAVAGLLRESSRHA